MEQSDQPDKDEVENISEIDEKEVLKKAFLVFARMERSQIGVVHFSIFPVNTV